MSAPDSGTGYRIEIHAGGRDIIVEHPGPLKANAERALALWRATAPKPGTKPAAEPGEAGGAGFVLAERGDRAGLMPAELELPARIADREDGDDVDRHRTGF